MEQVISFGWTKSTAVTFSEETMISFGDGRFVVLFMSSLTPLDYLLPGKNVFRLERFKEFRHKTALFYGLADVVPSLSGMASFRGRHSALDSADSAIVMDWESGHILSKISGCEHSSFFRNQELLRQIRDMKKCVRLWDLVAHNEYELLRNHIRWQADPAGGLALVYDSQIDMSPGRSVTEPDVITSATVDPELRSQLIADDLVTPAIFYIEKVINKYLDGRVTTRLLRNLDRKDLALYPVPRDYLCGIWLQFAEAVSGNKQYTRCAVCNSLFEVSARGLSQKDQDRKGRSDRDYCSPRCKQEAYRQRIEMARKLYRKGKKIESIAEIVGSEIKTVKGWISSHSTKRRRHSKKRKSKR